MKLKEYVSRFPEIDVSEIARGLGISRVTLWHAIQGKKMDLSIALKIQHGTGGIVKCEDLNGSEKGYHKANAERKKQQQQNDSPANAPIITEQNA